MTITTKAQLEAAAAVGVIRPFHKSGFGSSSGMMMSGWRAATMPPQPAIPSTAVTCDRATVGAIPIPAPSSGNTWYLLDFCTSSSSASGLFLLDRLAQVGGLSGTSTSAQTVGISLPARWTDYTAVQAYVEVYSGLGSTGQVATISYTNQAGTSGRSSSLIALPSSIASHSMWGPFPLQSGDTGIQSVQTLTLAASTGTAGNFGVILVRALAAAQGAETFEPGRAGWAETALPDLTSSPCLMLASTGQLSTVHGYVRVCQG